MRKTYDGYGAEMGIINQIDFVREFDDELKALDKLISAKKFATDKKKQRKVDDLIIGIDRKTLAMEIIKAMKHGDMKLSNSLQLVYWEKYLKGRVAREVSKGSEDKGSEVGIRIYLPEVNSDKGVAASSGGADGVSPKK